MTNSNDPPLGPSANQMVDVTVRQAIDQIDKDHNSFTVACGLSFDSLQMFEDSRADWHHSYSLAAHIRAMIFKQLNDYGWTTLHNELAEDDRAEIIGYDPENFEADNNAPHRTTFSRAWNDHMGPTLKAVINKIVQDIREYARKTGQLIGSQTLETEDKDDASPRTKYRFKRRKTHQVSERFRELFFDEIELNLPDNANYTKEDLLDLYLYIAHTDGFASGGSEDWMEDNDSDRPVPSGDTFLKYIRQFNELEDNEVSEMFDVLSEVLWNIADRLGYTDGITDVAVDEHDWLYYGGSDTPRISHVDPNQGTDKAFAFVTLSIIGDEGEKFIVGVIQVASRHEKFLAVRELVETASERLFVRDVVADRGFYGTLFAKAFEDAGENYVIRAQMGTKTNKMWDKVKDNEKKEDRVAVERVEMSRSRAPYVSVHVTRIVVAARDSVDYDYVTFITNRKLTRRQAKAIARSYLKRWGIETSYRVTGDFLPKTASRDFAIRQFYYHMAVLLYNVWIIINALVADSIDHPDDASPPVRAKYLLVVFRTIRGGSPVT